MRKYSALSVCSTIPTSLHAYSVVFPLTTATSTCRSRSSTTSGLYIFLAISQVPFVQFLSLIHQYKICRTLQVYADGGGHFAADIMNFSGRSYQFHPSFLFIIWSEVRTCAGEPIRTNISDRTPSLIFGPAWLGASRPLILPTGTISVN